MKVCRTCLQVLSSDAKCVSITTDECSMESTSIRSKLLLCVPEVVVDTNGAVICTSCSDALNSAYEFRNKCLETEERILNYAQFTGCSADSISVSEVVEFNQLNNDSSDAMELRQQLTDAHYPITQIIEQDSDVDIKPRDLANSSSIQSFLYNLGIKPKAETPIPAFPMFSPELDVEVRGYRTDGLQFLQQTLQLPAGANFAHVNNDSEKKNHCIQCQKSFALVSELEAHLMVHNMENRPLKCSYCQRRFVRNDKLQLHMRIHTGEKPYECTLCGRCFSRKDKLTNHMRTHTGEKPHQCILCQKSFARKDKMNVHMKSQHWLALANLEITVVKNAELNNADATNSVSENTNNSQ